MDEMATGGRVASAAAGLDGIPSRSEFIEKLPIAVYACDAAGRLLWFNIRAAELWGRAPLIGDDGERYCGSSTRYFGIETPMAKVLRTGAPIRAATGRIDRPDGSSIEVTFHIEPIHDDDG